MAAGAGISSAAGSVANAAVRNKREPQDISKIVIEQGLVTPYRREVETARVTT